MLDDRDMEEFQQLEQVLFAQLLDFLREETIFSHCLGFVNRLRADAAEA